MQALTKADRSANCEATHLVKEEDTLAVEEYAADTLGRK